MHYEKGDSNAIAKAFLSKSACLVYLPDIPPQKIRPL